MKHVHLIGIGGTGLSAIALVLLGSGYTVSGSDRQVSPVLDELRSAGAKVFVGHSLENLRGADLVVRSSAIPDENVEVQAARQAGIPVLKRADFLGDLTAGRLVIAVAGTHGKTTTTAMIAWMLVAVEEDPSFIVGGVPADLGRNAQAGRGPIFLVEADEYDRMFLGLSPKIAVVTNVEHDHPDCFPSREDYEQAFMDFAGRIEAAGVLLACGDDPGARKLLDVADMQGKRSHAYGVGLQPGTRPLDYHAGNLRLREDGNYTFTAYHGNDELAQVNLRVPGIHTVQNATAALAVAHLLELPIPQAASALEAFSGTSRRFEVHGELGGVTVIDDYAHHPTEIRATLAAARQRYADRRIWAVWQPHTYSRTQMLLAEFASAFYDADRVVVTEVYAAREPVQTDFSAAHVAAAMKHPYSYFAATLEQAGDYLISKLRPGDVVLVLSAGDGDKISARILSERDHQRRGEHA